ncbi:hypothetical protein AJ78_05846 [Emergomyces pasteurianus Ep9510]|uniref:Major facilitator superfamily (MFS) profile domain-containing protein n=1 Tax=Emergomyces pasteurianus Ep9510 TaxID=1447872 RepID=A0A1J9PCK6_9EURO|nr:hypothetical protein AJ78_05846 [Emergomyces pasteurianus Ep9510]
MKQPQETNQEKNIVEEKQDSPNITEVIDVVRTDEALKVIKAYGGDTTWAPAEEKRLVRKIDRKLMTILCITYGLQQYDKTMLSQAAIFGLQTDLDLKVGNRYSFSASIFYLGFIAGAYPAIYMAQRWPIERVASGIVLVWGVCLLCTIACHNWQALFAQRFFLGFLESGVSPMFMLVVGGWYLKAEQALRMGMWYSCTGYISAISPLINYGLGHITGSLSPWKYMYIVAGVITILWAVVIYFLMPPDPIRAKGFTDRERYIAVARMRVNNSGVRNTHFKIEQVWDAFSDLKFWIIFAASFLLMIANGPVSSFIPIFINSFGFSPLDSLLLTLPAGFIAGTIELVVCLIAYKYVNIRTWLVAICELGTIMASLLLWKLPRDQKGGLLFGTYFLASFGGAYAILMGLQVANTAGYTKRSVTSSGVFMGYCLGNFVGPIVFKPKDAPVYAPGFITVLVTAIVSILLAILYRYVAIHENRKRDNTGTMEAFEHAYDDDLTDRKVILHCISYYF